MKWSRWTSWGRHAQLLVLPGVEALVWEDVDAGDYRWHISGQKVPAALEGRADKREWAEYAVEKAVKPWAV